MEHGIRIARLRGIDIAIHPSWFVILAFVVWSLAEGLFPSAYAWSGPTYWVVAVIAALLLFASVLVHELAHSLVAKHVGIPVKSITLFLLGGVSILEKEPQAPRHELVMAGVGPLASLLIGGGSWGLGLALRSPETARAVLLYLGSVNVLLGIFNLLPGFPLDGGRLLRALLWLRSGDFDRATNGATLAGTVVGYLLVLAGVILAVITSFLGGIWLAFIGWMLIQASRTAHAQSAVRRQLTHILVRRVMEPWSTWLPPETTLREVRSQFSRDPENRCLPVGETGRPPQGVVCLADLRPERAGEDAADRRVSDVMRPRAEFGSVSLDDPASGALKLMAERNRDLVLVTDERGLPVGFVERDRLLRTAAFMPRPAGRSRPAGRGGSTVRGEPDRGRLGRRRRPDGRRDMEGDSHRRAA